MKEWKVEINCEHHIIVNKIAPKFRNRDDQLKYHEKRIAAKAFCSRGLRDGGEPQDEETESKFVPTRRPYHTWRKKLRQLYYQEN